jgi:hypothetical protein
VTRAGRTRGTCRSAGGHSCPADTYHSFGFTCSQPFSISASIAPKSSAGMVPANRVLFRPPPPPTPLTVTGLKIARTQGFDVSAPVPCVLVVRAVPFQCPPSCLLCFSVQKSLDFHLPQSVSSPSPPSRGQAPAGISWLTRPLHARDPGSRPQERPWPGIRHLRGRRPTEARGPVAAVFPANAGISWLHLRRAGSGYSLNCSVSTHSFLRTDQKSSASCLSTYS